MLLSGRHFRCCKSFTRFFHHFFRSRLACTTSSADTTLSSTSMPVRSVFTIQDPIPTTTHVSSSAPASITRDPTDDILPSPNLSVPGTPQIPTPSPPSVPAPVFHLSDHSPAVNPLPVARSSRVPVQVPVSTVSSSSIPIQAPNFQSLLTVAYPDTTQAHVLQAFPQFTSFDNLFPQNYFVSIGTMPTSLFIQFLVHALWWTSGLLRGMLTNYPLPSTLLPFDQIGRSILMASPVWPGTQFGIDSDLSEVLAAFLPLYTQL